MFEVYYKYPSQFILDNWPRLLPHWSVSPQAVIIILLKAQFPLDGEDSLISQEKDRLLAEFFKLTELFMYDEIISPVDGTPLSSTPGDLTFDIVAVVHQLLGFDFSITPKGCKVLKHPVWDSGVYPGILLSQEFINETL